MSFGLFGFFIFPSFYEKDLLTHKRDYVNYLVRHNCRQLCEVASCPVCSVDKWRMLILIFIMSLIYQMFRNIATPQIKKNPQHDAETYMWVMFPFLSACLQNYLYFI